MITGTFQGASIVALPYDCGSLHSVEFSVSDAVAIVSSPFTGQTQAQQWPGADMWTGTVTLPPLTQAQADQWISFLMELRGMANAFLLGDPMKQAPAGRVTSTSKPVVDMTTAGTNIVGSQTLYTRGWAPGVFRLLAVGDYIQVGYRLHRVLDQVNSDSNGKAQLSVWPSLRDLPSDGEPLVLSKPQGLFRLATNKRTWSADISYLTNLSFQIREYR
jgi:hypothetical protein